MVIFHPEGRRGEEKGDWRDRATLTRHQKGKCSEGLLGLLYLYHQGEEGKRGPIREHLDGDGGGRQPASLIFVDEKKKKRATDSSRHHKRIRVCQGPFERLIPGQRETFPPSEKREY